MNVLDKYTESTKIWYDEISQVGDIRFMFESMSSPTILILKMLPSNINCNDYYPHKNPFLFYLKSCAFAREINKNKI